MHKSNLNNPSIYPILSINFVGTLGFSIVLPFLIFLVIKFGGNAFIYGIMGATYSVFQLIGAPLLGKWSDIYGRRKILILSQIGTLISWFVFLFALYLPGKTILNIESSLVGSFTFTIPLLVLFFARALDGITGGNVSVANAYLADISENEVKSKNFGKMAVSANLGFIIGPAIAGLLGETSYGIKLPVIVALLISVIATFLIITLLKETKPKKIESDPEKINVRKVLGNDHKECFGIKCKQTITFFDVLKLKNISYLLTIYFLIFLGFNFFYIAFPIHAVQKLKWELNNTGAFFAFLGFLMVMVQGPLLSVVSKKLSDGKLIFFGNFLLAVSFIFFSYPGNLMVYVGAALLALGNGLMWPSVLSIIAKSTDEKLQGRVQGIVSSFGSLASIIGLLVGGLFYEQIGSNIFLVTSVVIFIVFIMSFKLYNFKTAI